MPYTIELLKVDDAKEPEFYEHDVYERLVTAAAQVGPRLV